MAGLLLLAAAVAAWVLLLYPQSVEEKFSGVPESFVESSKELHNPDRGFYRIATFLLHDSPEDYVSQLEEITHDKRDCLVLVEINLQDYREGPISLEGLNNLDILFEALGETGKRLIVRFLYDWEGENLIHEPENIDVILGHMEQLGPVITRHQEKIFTLQGLFVGNWGEGNGTKYDSAENTATLLEQLNQVTGGQIRLAVRTPAQWRSITASRVPLGKSNVWSKLGLFNDGMLGSESDYGTYGEGDGTAISIPWSRDLELQFQEGICANVVNGGEVIIDNPYNDFENALTDLKTMHVTYLNRDYDRAVLDKWAANSYQGGGCFAGMDGLTYIDRHLGYRLLIDHVEMGYQAANDWFSVQVVLRNVGFAPLYTDPKLTLTFWNADGRQVTCRLDQSLSTLSGGNRDQDILTVHADLLPSALPPGEYTVYFSMTDPVTGQALELANEGDPDDLGWKIGVLFVKS